MSARLADDLSLRVDNMQALNGVLREDEVVLGLAFGRPVEPLPLQNNAGSFAELKASLASQTSCSTLLLFNDTNHRVLTPCCGAGGRPGEHDWSPCSFVTFAEDGLGVEQYKPTRLGGYTFVTDQAWLDRECSSFATRVHGTPLQA